LSRFLSQCLIIRLRRRPLSSAAGRKAREERGEERDRKREGERERKREGEKEREREG